MKDISELTNLEFCNLLEAAENSFNGISWRDKINNSILRKCGLDQVLRFFKNYKLHTDAKNKKMED